MQRVVGSKFSVLPGEFVGMARPDARDYGEFALAVHHANSGGFYVWQRGVATALHPVKSRLDGTAVFSMEPFSEDQMAIASHDSVRGSSILFIAERPSLEERTLMRLSLSSESVREEVEDAEAEQRVYAKRALSDLQIFFLATVAAVVALTLGLFVLPGLVNEHNDGALISAILIFVAAFGTPYLFWATILRPYLKQRSEK